MSSSRAQFAISALLAALPALAAAEPRPAQAPAPAWNQPRVQVSCDDYLSQFTPEHRQKLRDSGAIACEFDSKSSPSNEVAQAAEPALSIAQKVSGLDFTPLTDEARELRECVKLSMSRRSFDRSSYGQCSADTSSPRRSGPVCLANEDEKERYADLMAASLIYASRCLDVRWQWYFPLFNQESGFRHNVFSYTGAGGMGQFTGVAIEEINRQVSSGRVEWPARKPGCELLGRDAPPSAGMKRDQKCSRIASPGNPLRSLAYTIALSKVHSEQTSEGMHDPSSRQNQVLAWVRQGMKTANATNAASDARAKEYAGEILAILGLHAHNAGGSAPWTILKELMLQKSRKAPTTDGELRVFFDEFRMRCYQTRSSRGLWGHAQTLEHAEYSKKVYESLPDQTPQGCLPAFMRTTSASAPKPQGSPSTEERKP